MATISFEQTLEAFIASKNFEDGVVSATKASWGSSGYSVELFQDGTWRVLWNGQIGNRYETPGVLLNLPTLNEDDTADIDEEEVAEHDEALREIFSDQREDLADELREKFAEK